MDLAILYIYAYLVGSVPTAYIIGRLAKGIDIRQYGSGNVGGTNVFYHVGRWWIVPLGLFEIFAKGASLIWIGLYVLGVDRSSPHLALASLAAITGHNWSLFLKFNGGRGIVVASGALFALAPIQLGIFIATALGGLAIFRSSAVWVLVSLASLPLWSVFLGQTFDSATTSIWPLRIGGPLVITWFCLGLLILTAIKRLLSNLQPLPQDVPLGRLLVNRLLRDRDTKERDAWVHRVPEKAERTENRE